MTKISLREYLQEIEEIIDRGQTEEAVAHCRHILDSFPKHIEAYRLMGKAFLESRRYGDAADIFQRVLSAIPDDFVSHVGMSIIREDEGNLDTSLWHMERAFEVQPYNAAIQNELRRLYGRRDGMEPPKVRLTQGALARMYAKGNLYQQAIAELRSALSEDPQRPDLQVVLARMYAENDQRVEAVETCSNLLKKLPYCKVANRILSQVLSETDREQEAQIYRRRLIDLDVYEAHVSPNHPNAADVPDQAVSLSRLEWDPGMIGAETDQPEWATSLGVELEDEMEEEPLPDWFSTPSGDQVDDISTLSGEDEDTKEKRPEDLAETPEAHPESESIEDDIIPDWMKEADREHAREESHQDLASFAQDDSPESEGVAQADIPSWLEDIAPSEAEDTDKEHETPFLEDEAESYDLPDWIQELEDETPFVEDIEDETVGAEVDEAERDQVPDSIQDDMEEEETPVVDSASEEPEQAEVSEVPEEPFPSEEELEIEQVSDVSDEERVLGEPESEEEPVPPGEYESVIPATDQEEAADLPDWLQELEDTSEAEPSDKDFDIEEVEPGEVPEWLQDIAKEAPASEDIVLDSEETIEDVEHETADVPDWLQDVLETPPEHVDVEDQITSSMDDEEFPFELDDEDAALAWLESLAAKQGADEEELITSPEERPELSQELEPEDMSELEKLIESGPEEELAPTETAYPEGVVEEETPSEQPSPEEEPPAWLKELEEEIPPVSTEEVSEEIESEVETAPLDTSKAELPEWLAELEGEELKATEAHDEITPDEPSEAEIPEWLAELEEQEVSEVEQEEPEAELGVIPQEPSEAETPEWLAELEDEEPEVVETEPEEPVTEPDIVPKEPFEAETPEWLAELLEEPHVEQEEEVVDEPPAWVFEETPQEPEMPSEPSEEDQIEEPPGWIRDVLPEEEIEAEEVELEPKDLEPEIEVDVEPIEEGLEEIVEPTFAEQREVTIEGEAEEDVPEWVLEELEPEELEDLEELSEELVEEVLVDLNTATINELQELPGVGPYLAENIIAHRDAYGPFRNMDELMDVAGLGPATVEGLSGHITVQVPEGITPDKPVEDEYDPLHEQAKEDLTRGEIDNALNVYNQLISSEYQLDQIIQDLGEAADRHPINIDLLQSLGDAYMRADRLKEALETYTKAEELLR